MLADVGLERFHARAVLAGFLLDLCGGILGFDVVEDYIGAGLCEEFDGCCPDAARTAGDECRLACERNHEAPKEVKSPQLKVEGKGPRHGQDFQLPLQKTQRCATASR